MSKDRFHVSSETERMLSLGHPWVIADASTRKWPKGRPGDVIGLYGPSGGFLATALYDPKDRVVARVLGHEPLRLDKAWLGARLASAVQLRTHHVATDETDAYRLVNGEGDGLPGLTVDRYGAYLMVQLYTLAWAPHLDTIVQVLRDLLSPVGIYEKFRPQQTRSLAAQGENKKYGRLLWGEKAPPFVEVRENGLTFRVSLEEGLNTGLFLDQRVNRRDLMTRCRGSKVLNLFAYTGAFSVACAAAGAERVTTVDASAAYLDWARSNFEANRLNPRRHEFIEGDCFAVLEALQKEKRRFDIILMDPPSFSTTRKSRFTTVGGTSDLVALALPLLNSGGLLVTASNHQKVDVAEYLKELRKGALQVRTDLRVIGLMGQPEDFPYTLTFPEGRYLKYVMAVKP